ncbi:MAG TPA: hypothetical protein VGA58_13725 [bacterium]
MSRGGFREGAGDHRSKHGLIAEAAGIMQLQAMKLYAIALRDGKLPTRTLGEISRAMLRETMAARRRIQKALHRGTKNGGSRRVRERPRT